MSEHEKSRDELLAEVLALRQRLATLEHGGTNGMVGISAEITALRAAEEELRRSHDQLEIILHGIDDGVYLLGADGRVTFVNEAGVRYSVFQTAQELLDLTPDELGHRVEHFDEHGRPLPVERLPGYRVLAGEPKAEEIIHWRDRVTGREGWGLFRAWPIRTADGRVRNAVLIAHDVTDRRRLEEQVRQAQKMEAVGRLAGGVAHDFNNLLTTILGYGEMAWGAVGLDHPARSAVEEVLKAARRAADLTGQLLAFGRKQFLAPRVLDLNAVVREAERLLGPVVGGDIRLVTRLAPDLGPVRIDPGQIRQVLLDLAFNARDAMPRGGSLTVTTANVTLDDAYARKHLEVHPGPYVLLSVADTGTGMTPEVKARVFEPFFTTKGVGQGTGLGLAAVYGAIKQSGGHVEVESTPGRGTTFRVYLPRCGGAGPELAAAALAPAPGGTETLLLAEDEEQVRAFIRLVLERRGYRVLAAADGPEALDLAARHPGPIDLLVTDVVMPGMSGRDLADRLAAVRPGLRTLYLSGFTEDAAVRHGLSGPEVTLLTKPFTPDALVRKVREVLDR